MPQFINSPYSSSAADGGVGGMLTSMGQSMFGDTARRALVTQQMLEKQRHNENAEPYAAALRDHQASQALYYGSQAGHLGQDLGAGNLASAAAAAGPNYRDPTLATAALGAGHPAGGTFPGMDVENAGRLAQTKQQGANQIAAEQSKPVTIMGPDGALHLVPSNQTEHLINAGGYRLVPTADQSLVMGDMQGQQPAAPGAPPAAAPAQPAAPQAPQPIQSDPSMPGAQSVPGQPAVAAPPPIAPDTTAQHFSPASLPPQTKPVPQPAQPGADSSVTATAKMIANGQIPPLNGMAMKTPWGQHVMAAVAQINPSYRAQTYNQENKAQSAFGAGPLGNTVRSFDVGISHLGTLEQLSNALGNGDVKMVNAARQMWQSQTGMPAPANFAAAKDIVAAEITKAVIGANGALGDREGAQATINAANSPEQLRGVIQTYKTLMAGQLKGLKHQYETSTGQHDFESHISPETAQQLLGDQQQGGETWVRGPDGKLTRGQ